jgi:hypothetical protein
MSGARQHALAVVAPPDLVHVELPKATGGDTGGVLFDFLDRPLVAGCFQHVVVFLRFAANPYPQAAQTNKKTTRRVTLSQVSRRAVSIRVAGPRLELGTFGL